MKTKLLLLLVLCVSSWARAQTNITAQGSDCTTTNACAAINLPASAGAVGVTIDGTFTATLQFEVSADRGKTWVSAQGTPLDGTTGVTSVNAAGVWRFAVSGLTGIRVRCSAYVSGTVIVNLQQSPTAASLGGGGSSTPAFSSITAGNNNSGAAMVVTSPSSLTGNITAQVGAFTGATQYFFPVFGASGAIGNSLCSTDAGLTLLTCTYSAGLSIAGSGGGIETFLEAAAPANPSANNDRLYADSTTHTLKCLTSSGGNCLAGGSGTVTSVATTAPITGGTFTTSGTIACATCATTTNGGALSGTAPVAVSVAGAISVTGAAGQVLAGSGPAFTATPTLGVAGSTVGSVAFQNATSGTITVQPVTGALGTVTQSLPAAAGTFAVSATAPITESAAGAVGCASCATTSGGGSLTLDQVGAAAASWSPANADQPLTLNFASTTSGRVSFKIGETSASTSAGTPYLAQIVAASGSTAVPLDLQQTETGSQALSMLKLEPTLNTSGSPDIVAINATETSDGASTNFLHFKGGASAATDEFIVSKAGTISANGTYGATATSSIVTLRGAAAHVESTATAIPTVTAGCGTSPVVQTGATDNWFRLNVGTGGTATTCTVTFQKAFTQIPACVVNDESAIVTTQAVPTTTTVVLNIAVAWAASSILDVHCGI